MFELYTEEEIKEFILKGNKELVKRHCKKVGHCEKCLYIYLEEDCEMQHLINLARSEYNA